MNSVVFIFTVKAYIAIKISESILHRSTWINVENIMMSEKASSRVKFTFM